MNLRKVLTSLVASTTIAVASGSIIHSVTNHNKSVLYDVREEEKDNFSRVTENYLHEIEPKPEIERGLTKLVIPHEGNYVTFVYSGEGPDSYRNALRRIFEKNLRPATGEETASLFYSIFCDEKFINKSESKKIRGLLRNSPTGNWLWVPNINLWTPEGVYVVYDEKGMGQDYKLDVEELESSLKNAKEIGGVKFSENGKIRFAPKNTYIVGQHSYYGNDKNHGLYSYERFAENGFIIASYGLEGAKKLEEVTRKFQSDPCIWTIDVDRSEQKNSALFCGPYIDLRLFACAAFNDNHTAYFVGVLPESER